MEFFIPSILVFLLAIIVCFIFIPRFTPLIIAILSIAFLTYGVYDHYKMFAAEYRLSTWQESLKIYAPAIMIGSIILFIIYTILAFFSRGAVPIPSIPNIKAPEENTITGSMINSINKTVNSLTNTKSNVVDSVNKSINKVNNNKGNVLNLFSNNENKANKNKNNGNLSRSFLETI